MTASRLFIYSFFKKTIKLTTYIGEKYSFKKCLYFLSGVREPHSDNMSLESCDEEMAKQLAARLQNRYLLKLSLSLHSISKEERKLIMIVFLR